MISELGPIHPGAGTRPQTLAKTNQAANRPPEGDVRRLAEAMRNSPPAGAVPASPPGVGGGLDVYAADLPRPDLPFLKPLSDGSVGQTIDTVI